MARASQCHRHLLAPGIELIERDPHRPNRERRRHRELSQNDAGLLVCDVLLDQDERRKPEQGG